LAFENVNLQYSIFINGYRFSTIIFETSSSKRTCLWAQLQNKLISR